MSRILEFRLAKGITTASTKNDEWLKKSLELTIQLPEQTTEQGFQDALIHAEYLIDNYLGQPETPQIPNINTEELMKHKWEGRKIGEGQYSEGSLSWGWDFTDKFSPEIIAVLKKGPLHVGEYEFSLAGGGGIVSTKKTKEK